MTGPKKPPMPIPVEELGEGRWERIERRLLEARDRERSGEVGRGAPTRPERSWAWRWMPVALGSALAVGAAVYVITMIRPLPPVVIATAPAPPAIVPTATRLVTPPGAPTRLQIGDAVVLVAGDTEVEITQGDGIRVTLARGAVDCDVAPRDGRPPFLVVAGDVTVTVVGTQFQVEKAEAVKVTVTHGKVNVCSPSGERQVAQGESWASGEMVAASEPPPSVADPPATRPVDPRAQEKALLRKAESLDRSQPKEAEKIYLGLVQARDRGVAARSIYSLALLDFNARRYDSAARWSERYLGKFPSGRNADDVFQIRVEAYFALEYNQRARDVAREYLQRFPASRYAERARRIANWVTP